jgi:hypothetical protein
MAESPTYYTRGSMETWDFIRDQGLNYHLGCAIKYIVRAGYKDSKADDLKKAIHYLQNELQHALTETKSNGHGGAIPLSVFFGEDSDDYAEIFDR